jgi:hypothetical protein
MDLSCLSTASSICLHHRLHANSAQDSGKQPKPQIWLLWKCCPRLSWLRGATIMMSLPLPSNYLHQWLGAVWQGSPVWVMLLQKAFAFLSNKANANYTQSVQKAVQPGAQPQRTSYLCRSLSASRIHEQFLFSKTYLFALISCFIFQLGPLLLIAFSLLYPSALPHRLRYALTVSNVFIPPPFYATVKMKSMASAVHNFFQYDQYVGSAAAITWATALYTNSRRTPLTKGGWASLLSAIMTLSLLSGPAGAVLYLMWRRDSMVLSDDQLYEEGG